MKNMQMFIVFLIFVGTVLIINGTYEEKLNQLKENKQVEYKFIPRTLYEEQMSESLLSTYYKPIKT